MSQLHQVLVVGAGSIGERHARCFGATGRATVSLCELDDARRRAVSQRCGISHSFATWEEALASRPAAVVIATPAHLHVEMAHKAIAQDCHVLIEKPLSVSLEGAVELQALAANRGVAAAVAYVYRCHPALTAMRSALLAGKFGAPLQVVAISGQHFPFYRPAYRDTYYTRHETGGGAVQDALTHLVNAAEWLVGPVERLVADTAHLALPGVTVEDTAQVLTRHGGVLGCFSLNQHQAPNEGMITVIGERGAARFEFHHHRWRWTAKPEEAWQEEIYGPLERDALFITQAHHFLDVIEGRAVPICTLADAVQTLRANLAILESAHRQTWEVVSNPALPV